MTKYCCQNFSPVSYIVTVSPTDSKLDRLQGVFVKPVCSCREHITCTGKYKRHACLLVWVREWGTVQYKAEHLPAVIHTQDTLQCVEIREGEGGGNQIKVRNTFVVQSSRINLKKKIRVVYERVSFWLEIKNYQNVISTNGINFVCRFMEWVGGGGVGVRVETTCHIEFVVRSKIRKQCSLCS